MTLTYINIGNTYGAIQKIRDTLGGRGGGCKNFTGQFLLVILLVKVDKTCHMGGGGVLKVRKRCHVLFEWPL
jgi:hypothetical protein